MITARIHGADWALPQRSLLWRCSLRLPALVAGCLWLGVAPARGDGGTAYVRFDAAGVAIVRGSPVAGRTPDELVAGVGKSMHTLAFLAAAAEGKGVSGTVQVRLTVEFDGSVTAARVLESTINDTATERGVLRALMRWKFGAVSHAGSATTFSFRLVFGSGTAVAAPPRATTQLTVSPTPRVPQTMSADRARYLRTQKRTVGGVLLAAGAGIGIVGAASFVLGMASDGEWFANSDTVLKGAGIGCFAVSGTLVVSGVVVLGRSSSGAPKVALVVSF